jgi:putative hydrolase of the HAD superfamily
VIRAVTLDFYNTLVYHRDARGRGAMVMAYLAKHGLHGDAWEHVVLYDLFASHHRDYHPAAPLEEKQRYYEQLAERLFQRLNIRAPSDAAAEHATALWSLLGPDCFAVFPEIGGVLATLRRAGYPLAIVSNWQCGLGHLCDELGLGDAFEHILSSAELDCAKPDPRIFAEACRRLGVPAKEILHVGDTMVDDIDGARDAGLQAVLVWRSSEPAPAGVQSIRALDHLPGLLGLD